MFEFLGCAIDVPPQQMSAIVRTESSGNPFAVGVVGNKLNRQPTNHGEAKELVNVLRAGGYNFSVGLAQVNQINFNSYGLTDDDMFNPCKNLLVGSKILNNCYLKYDDWSKAYSCYYSGNAVTGFRHGYVKKILANMKHPILESVNIPNSSSSPISISTRKGGIASEPIKPSLVSRRLQSSLSKIN